MNINLSKITMIAATTGLLFSVATSVQAAEKRYTLGSLATGTTPFLVNTAFAKAVNKHVPGHKIQVSAVGVGMKHQLLVTRGKMDFAMGGPIGYHLMYKQIGPFRKLPKGAGPKLVKKMKALFSYEIGVYHPVVYANSGIKSFMDIKGKKVFLGPPSGAATRNMILIVRAMTGYEAGKDFEQVRMGWGPAQQAFQDRKFDVWATTTTAPSPAVQQLTLTNKIRILSLDKNRFNHPAWKKYINQPGRTMGTINPKVYGSNLINKEPITVTGAWVGMVVRADMSTDLVYKMMKAFWDNIDEAHALSSQLKKTLTLKNAVTANAGELHPGAIKYYKEKGIKIPTLLNYDKK